MVAPIMSSSSASACSRLSGRRRHAHSSRPVVTIFRLPRIWYVAASTCRSVQNCARDRPARRPAHGQERVRERRNPLLNTTAP